VSTDPEQLCALLASASLVARQALRPDVFQAALIRDTHHLGDFADESLDMSTSWILCVGLRSVN